MITVRKRCGGGEKLDRWFRRCCWILGALALWGVGPWQAEGAPRTLREIRHQDELRVGIENDSWGRFHIWEGDRVYGLEVDLAERIAQATGVKLRIVPMPWGNGEPGSLSATWLSGLWEDVDFLLASVTADAERSQRVTFSDWYFSAGQTVLFRRALNVRTPEDLAGRRVAFQGATTSETVVLKVMPQSVPKPFPTWSAAFAAFQSGDVDAVVVDSPLAIQKVREDPELQVLGVLLSRERYGAVLPKDVDPEFKALVDEVIRQVREELFRKWFS